MTASLSTEDIARELADYQVELSEAALGQLSSYLELLLRWNRRINLTGLREPRAIVRRLFGESLYLGRLLELRGWLVDIGSGAGFPGLALKLVAPDLRVTLVESRGRKCAFLKEAVRECSFYGVDVVTERFEAWVARQKKGKTVDITTTRAVRMDKTLLECVSLILRTGGMAVFFTTTELAERVGSIRAGWRWERPVGPPASKDRVILVGRRE